MSDPWIYTLFDNKTSIWNIGYKSHFCHRVYWHYLLFLNGLAVVTIFKSSQLNSKPCYFIVLFQSMFDLGVGVFRIPLFIYYLANSIGGIFNCFAASLGYRLTLVPVGNVYDHNDCDDNWKIHCYPIFLRLQNSSDEKATFSVYRFQCSGGISCTQPLPCRDICHSKNSRRLFLYCVCLY